MQAKSSQQTDSHQILFNCNQCLWSTINLLRQLRYAWLEILFKSANQNILLRLHSYEKPYEKPLVSPRDIQTLENNDKNTRASRSCIHYCFLVFGYPG